MSGWSLKEVEAAWSNGRGNKRSAESIELNPSGDMKPN
jgi:hypothetical protein